MNQALLSEVLDWLREPSGKCDREDLVATLNACRERFYLLYPDVPLFYVGECFVVQRFPAGCNDCRECYHGVTLPRDYQTVEAMWLNDYPIELHSQWREWQRGMLPECPCHLQKVDMPGLVSTFADIEPSRPSRLKIHAENRADVGKTITIRGKLVGGDGVTRKYTLGPEPFTPDDTFQSIAFAGGVTKDRTAGRVVLAQDDGRLLSVYEPDETVPGYRRIKIVGLSARDNHVNIRAARRYFPLWNDSDVVETNNRTAFEEMARFLRINSKTSKTADDLRVATYHAGQAKGALAANKARDVGNATTTDLRFNVIGEGFRQLGWP